MEAVAESSSKVEQVSSEGMNDEDRVKDPRKIARKYQLDLCRLAVDQNIIVYLGTGCGKTHIAVLLIYELGHLIRKPSKSVCVFLAPTVPLVQQQSLVIENTTNFKLKSYFGNVKRSKDHREWEEEMQQYEVLVMTPQILLYNLRHCFIKMELIALLIFDECHHAQGHKRHPYAQIMKEFYKTQSLKRPRIFGMTASPVIGKGGPNKSEYTKCINSLEHLLDAKVYTVNDHLELESFVADPDVKIYQYGGVGTASSTILILRSKLDNLKEKFISVLREETSDYNECEKKMKQLWRVHDSLIFCLENIGLMGSIKAARIFSSDCFDLDDNDKAHSLSAFVSEACTILSSEVPGEFESLFFLERIEEPWFSKKLSLLIDILSTYREMANVRCIIFVKRIVVARTLVGILGSLKSLDFWKCECIVGFHSGMRNMSRKNMDVILNKFSSGQVNLLVTTNVAEEGLDIQTCGLVVRFDLPETVASFIQSRGRARLLKSEYVCLVERGNRREEKLLNDFMSSEKFMNDEIVSRTCTDTFDVLEEKIYKVYATGASISTGCSITLLHGYCSKLPRDMYFTPAPKFFFFEELEGIVCRVILPPNAPFRQVDSPPCLSKDEAKRVACLEACIELHARGSLSDYLLPDFVDSRKNNSENSAGIDSVEDDLPREELHEALVPAALRNRWVYADGDIIMNFYLIAFTPIPEDRTYRKFGFLVKTPLSREVEEMILDLHLAHGRIVRTSFLSLGMIKFTIEEMMLAEMFQEMFLKVILDRSEYFADFIPLGAKFSLEYGSSTFYLLLPLLEDVERSTVIDWNLIRYSLSSPAFGHPISVEQDTSSETTSLHLLNGSLKRSEVSGCLVYTPHNNFLFFVDGILDHLNAYSRFSFSGGLSYVEHYREKFGIELLHPQQPLLKAKQLFCVRNLLLNRVKENTEARETVEHFVEIPPELCSLKIFGFSKDIGSSLSLLPSVMHRVENLLVAIELKELLSACFPEANEIRASCILEALTTEKCMERLSLERYEVLGDAFLKYVVGRHCFLSFEGLDEGQLTRKRSSIVNNSHLYELAISKSLQVYIRDELFEPSQFFAFGRPCKLLCDVTVESVIHCDGAATNSVKCTKIHRWLHRKSIADVVEALIGVFLVESGFKAAIAFLHWIGIQVDIEAEDVNRVCTESQINLSLMGILNVKALEEVLDYKFQHKGLLVQAFVHPSYQNHSGGCYQKLEFLGDAVLEYLITSYLYSIYPDLKPGQLTDLRSLTVNNNSFARIAVQLSFHLHLIKDSDCLTEAIKRFEEFQCLSDIEKDALEEPQFPKVLSDLVESSIGAILLDSKFNLRCVWKTMLRMLEPVLCFTSLQVNPVKELRGLCQSLNFELELPDPVKVRGGFSVQVGVCIKGEQMNFSATNLNSKAARRIAAQVALKRMKVLGYKRKSKSLEDVLCSTRKKKPQLIGFDEVLADEYLDNPDVPCGSVLHGLSETPHKLSILRKKSSRNHSGKSTWSVDFPSISSSVGVGLHRCEHQLFNPDGVTANSNFMSSKTAKSRLVEICTRKYWNLPEFLLCKEEGLSHERMFTYSVTIKVETVDGTTLLQCFSNPKPQKKAAEQNAAEGVLWYLKHIGVL